MFLPVYEIETFGPTPVSLAEMKLYLKATSSTAQDDLITGMLEAATLWGESYTGRDFRENDWKLLLNCFDESLELQRDPVALVTTIEYLKDGLPVIIDDTVYYLIKQTQESFILLQQDQEWPDDVDERFQAITIKFKTEPYYREAEYKEAILRHVAFWFANRGDCGGSSGSSCTCDEALAGSGVKSIYDQFRISRIP